MILDPTTQSSSKIHRADLAGRSWDVLRNSWGTERSYLQRETKPKLRSAAWIQSEAVRKLVAMGGWIWTSCLRKRNRKTSSRLNCPCDCRRVASQVRPFVVRSVLVVLPSRGSAATEAVLCTAQYDHLGVDLIGMATTFLTARLIMRLAAPCSWS